MVGATKTGFLEGKGQVFQWAHWWRGRWGIHPSIRPSTHPFIPSLNKYSIQLSLGPKEPTV